MSLRGFAGDLARNSAGMWKVVADVVDPSPRTRRPPASGDGPASSEVEQATIDVDAGQMLVPIDAWTRILEQVGHVHEAGQQLAEARERAARAETENEFLRQQLRDLKAQRRAPRRPAAPAEPSTSGSGSDAGSAVPAAAGSGQERVRRARERASRWLSPK